MTYSKGCSKKSHTDLKLRGRVNAGFFLNATISGEATAQVSFYNTDIFLRCCHFMEMLNLWFS